MTTANSSTATIHPEQAAATYCAPRCELCAGRLARRLDSYSAGQTRAEGYAKTAAARLGNGAHVHFSSTDDRFVVVRAVDPAEEVTP